jgi:hypothetical protein
MRMMLKVSPRGDAANKAVADGTLGRVVGADEHRGLAKGHRRTRQTLNNEWEAADLPAAALGGLLQAT